MSGFAAPKKGFAAHQAPPEGNDAFFAVYGHLMSNRECQQLGAKSAQRPKTRPFREFGRSRPSLARDSLWSTCRPIAVRQGSCQVALAGSPRIVPRSPIISRAARRSPIFSA